MTLQHDEYIKLKRRRRRRRRQHQRLQMCHKPSICLFLFCMVGFVFPRIVEGGRVNPFSLQRNDDSSSSPSSSSSSSTKEQIQQDGEPLPPTRSLSPPPSPEMPFPPSLPEMPPPPLPPYPPYPPFAPFTPPDERKFVEEQKESEKRSTGVGGNDGAGKLWWFCFHLTLAFIIVVGTWLKARELTLNPEMRYRAQANFRRPVTRLRSPTQTYERVE